MRFLIVAHNPMRPYGWPVVIIEPNRFVALNAFGHYATKGHRVKMTAV